MVIGGANSIAYASVSIGITLGLLGISLSLVNLRRTKRRKK